MGGRGARAGFSFGGKAYGTQYHSLLEFENIKFVAANSRESESLLETMTHGRIYVTVGGEKDLLQVSFFDEANKRTKTIDLSHYHNGLKPHVHHGYYHNEDDNSLGGTEIGDDERALLDKIYQVWYAHIGKR